MNSLHKSLTALLEKLEENGVLQKEKFNTVALKTEELAKHIRDRFAKEYADLEIRRLLEKVHYANTYEDKVLKETAFLVDEISEYMFKLEVANRDFVVGYFNTLIINPAIEATEYNFVLMEVEFAKLSASDLAKVYKIKEDKATEEFSRWKDIKNNTAKSYKALDLFNGLMYRNINRDNFDEADKEYIEKNVFITTSLYGIIGAYDLIQEHRLDFLQNVKISGESLKNFWRASYDESIKDEGFVVSLLSSEFE